MIAILMIVAGAVALCMIFNRKLHETLPPAVFIVTLAVYLFALVLPLNVSVWIVAGLLLLVLTAWGLVLLKTGRLHTYTYGGQLPGFIVLAIFGAICLVFFVLFGNRRVFYYDDLSYWAIYTKNIFTIDRLPHLYENCSVDYKDYTPIIQILQYMVMFGQKSFSEPALFRTNVCLIYTLLLPMLSVIDDACANKPAKIASAVFYVIFPHILTAQFYYRLGVDLFLALTFGYVLYYTFMFESNTAASSQEEIWGDLYKGWGRDEVFRIGCVLSALAFLALIKSSGIVLCILAIIMFAVREIMAGDHIQSVNRSRAIAAKILLISVFAVGSYFSWQLFLHYSWNNGYLTNRVKNNVTDGLKFPVYTGEVLRNYVNRLFTYPLTRNSHGVTAFMLVLFIIVVYAVLITSVRKTVGKSKSSGPSKLSGSYSVLFATSMIGLVIFCIAHISMYLFVFDEWEAHGLLEYDRYITQYLGGIFYVFVCIMLCVTTGEGNESETGHEPREDQARSFANPGQLMTFISLIVFIALLPYKDMKEFLIPDNYMEMFNSEYAQMSKAASDEWKSSGIMEMNLVHDGSQRLTVIANVWDETTQFIEYESVPQPIDRLLNVPSVEEGKILSAIDDYLDDYLYVAKGSKAAYVGNWEETAAVTDDNTPLREGTLYRVNRLNGVKTLSPVY